MLLPLLLALAAPIVQIQLQGEYLDPPDVLETVIRSEVGDEYVPDPKPGPDGQIPEDAPKGTQALLSATLSQLGYDAAFATQAAPGGGLILLVRLRPIPRLRQVFVKPIFGKFPILGDEILQQTRFHAGLQLPPPKVLEEQFSEDKDRIAAYLQRQGYFEGRVDMSLRKRDRPEQLTLDIFIEKGDRYHIDEAGPQVIFEAGSDTQVISARAIQDHFHHHFQLTCLWLCGEFSVDRLRRDISSLIARYHDKGYYGARVHHDFDPEKSLDARSNVVSFHVVIATGRRAEILFRGNGHIADEILHGVLSFDEAGSVDRFECQSSAQRIHRKYQEEGFYQVDVDARREELAQQNLVRVTFFIDEGPELKIRGVDFAGNLSFSAEALQGTIETRPFPAIGLLGLGEGGYLTNKQLSQDEERIVDFYHKHGYRETKVAGEVATDRAALGEAGATAAAVATGEAGGGDLYVRFVIDEGPRVDVDSVEITYEGEHSTDPAEALRHTRLRAGQPLTDEALRLDKQALERWLHTSGYPYAIVRAKTYELPNHRQPIRFEINEMKASRFGQTIIRGNFMTWRSVVERELHWKPGDVFDESKIEEADRSLRSLDLFTRLKFQRLQAAANPSIVHTYIEVEERHDDYGSIEVAGGYATDYRAYLTLSYVNRNLIGSGWGFEASGTLGQRRVDARGTFINPRLFDARLRLELTGFFRREDTVRLGVLRTKGFQLTLFREILPRTRLFMRYELRQVARDKPFDRSSGPNEDVSTTPITTVVTNLGPGIDFDRRDNILMPTKGFFASASAFLSAPFLDPCLFKPCQTATFLKFNVTTKSFVPLGRGINVVIGLRYDHGVPLGKDEALLPEIERFFAGGDTTVRGFEEDQLKTEIIPLPVPPLADQPAYRRIPLGGNIRILNNLELIFPLRKSSTLPLNAALFLDTGLVTNSFDGLALADFRHSIGIAPFRFNTPVGFASLEWAWPLDPGPGDDPSGRFHFNFGFIF